jgi:hypothetical protein
MATARKRLRGRSDVQSAHIIIAEPIDARWSAVGYPANEDGRFRGVLEHRIRLGHGGHDRDDGTSVA